MKRSILLLVVGISSALLPGCKPKQEKTCAQEGKSGGKLEAPWKDLDVASGEICESTASQVKFIVKNEKDPVGAANKIADKLSAKGYKPVEGTLSIQNLGKGEDAMVDINGWRFKNGDKSINLTMDSYPGSVWKDDPVTFRLQMQ